MRIAEAGFSLESDIDGDKMLQSIERAGRTAHKSRLGNARDSAADFVKRLLALGHESVIEHCSVSVRIICDRGVSHEIVRHRIASYTQESTRYCNYAEDRFQNEVTFIKPVFWSDGRYPKRYEVWLRAMESAEKAYLGLIEMGASPQEARSVLPSSLKTEVVVTMNLREWRHFFKLRCASNAHPQMQQIAKPLLQRMKEVIPVVFDDLCG